MSSTINDKIRSSLESSEKESERIIDNDLIFKKKLNIGEDAYRYLKAAKNIIDFGEAAGTGTGVAAITGAAWYASLGVFGKFALLAGFSSTPVGWIAGAGTATALGVIGLKKIFRKVKDKSIDNIPKFLNTPLDAVALSVFQVLFPPAMRMACVDSNFCIEEKNTIQTYFEYEWGYNPEFISKNIDSYAQNIKAVDYRAFKEALSRICGSTKEIKNINITKELLSFLEEIIRADGKIALEESNELECLKVVLQSE